MSDVLVNLAEMKQSIKKILKSVDSCFNLMNKLNFGRKCWKGKIVKSKCYSLIEGAKLVVSFHRLPIKLKCLYSDDYNVVLIKVKFDLIITV